MLDSLKNKEVKLFIVLSGFFIANAICAEFMGVKIFSLENSLHIVPFKLMLFGNPFSFNLSSGVLLWPVVFIMTDIINEFYGSKGVKFLSYLTAALIAYAFFMFFWTINLSPADFWTYSKVKTGIPNMDLAFNQIFGQGLGIIIGSLIAFLLGQVVDVLVFHRIKKLTGEKFIWLRSTGSTLVSQFIDSFVVLFIAFYFYPRMFPGLDAPWSAMLVLSIGLGNYLYKFIVAIAMTPVIYLIHNAIEKYLGHELASKMKEKAACD
jgi:queuosine precursor transporter